MNNIYLGLGTNLGDKKHNIDKALQLLEEYIGEVVKVSPLYETKPVGFDSANDFINAVCYIMTEFTPFEVLEKTQNIEKEMGRISKSVNKEYSDRIIDIDLLLFNNLVLQEDNLILPHPYLHLREFVIYPLSDIAPDLIHPVLNKTMYELKKGLSSSL
jgi:2-amino-4-hydroxy-6-hydroxymethyldihydropteridine diphosphokinase